MPDRRHGDSRRLFLLGFLTLFLELALIRYLAGTIWNLGYFPNLVLLAVFVGMGVGFVFHHRFDEALSHRMYRCAPSVALALALFVHLLRPSVPGFTGWAGSVGGELFFSGGKREGGTQGALPFLLWFAGVASLFALVSQRTAKVFRRLPPLRAYTLDIAGSCAGILAFMAISAGEVPAAGWFALLVPLVAAADEGRPTRRALAAAPLLAMAGLCLWQDRHLTSNPAFDGTLEVRWSPYQKVEYTEEDGRQQLFVNGITHQAVYDRRTLASSYYSRPYQRRAALGWPSRSVLVIGAGTGNDVAAALLAGAERVDAVEIDPAIARFGRRHHPAAPYDDPRVRLIVDDGRAVLTRSRERYDLIVFALTDSLVKVSPLAQLRLENYLYTVESLRRAHDLLTDRGEMILYNFYRTPWLVEKHRLALREGTGKLPRVILRTGDFAMLAAGPATFSGESRQVTVGVRASGRTSASPSPGVDPRSAVEETLRPQSAPDVQAAHDDWPFPYLQRRGIPGLYAGALGVMATLVTALGLVLHRMERRQAGPAVPLRQKGAFLLMGTAFLLLETKGVIQFSLLFGTTWINNSLVFLAVLLLVLAANATATVVTHRALMPAAYGLLLASSLVGLLVPLSSLLAVEQPLLRFVLGGLLVFSPIFFANLIFSVSFRGRALAEHLFGWNLLGAAVGGLLEYASMAVGYRALAALVALLYTFVAAILLRERPVEGAAEAAA